MLFCSQVSGKTHPESDVDLVVWPEQPTPSSYRDAFRLAGDHGLLPSDLAERLQEATGMRNTIVYLYEEIDLAILRVSIDPAPRDFGQLVAVFEARLDEMVTS